jgi:hypothetical protein
LILIVEAPLQIAAADSDAAACLPAVASFRRRPPGQDPLSWKVFDHTCEKYSTIRDQGIMQLRTGRNPEPGMAETRWRKQASGNWPGPPQQQRELRRDHYSSMINLS